MPSSDWKSAPADADAVASFAARDLEYRVVRTDDRALFDPYLRAETRGFLGGEQTEEQLEGTGDALAFRRFIGVYDPAALTLDEPVGTVNSWATELTLPENRSIPMWAISGVTVAPTHRRRGIARGMLEGELRTARDAGFAIAGLTVSEATIYGRFGFAPATFSERWTIETKRARWIGARAEGRLDFVSRERLSEELAALHGRVRTARPGEIEAWPGLWRRLAGTLPAQENSGKIRAVRYADVDGVTRGVVVYRLSEEGTDYTKHELEVDYLLSETADAYSALWAYVLEHDLVTTVVAQLRAVDEPLRWMIADQRAAKVETREHGWLRIVDVPTVLTARTYARGGRFTLSITDALGFADGTWELSIDDSGDAAVVAHEGEPDITLSVGALSSIVLGGVRASTLHAAGIIHAEEGVVTHLDACFMSAQTPYLSLWY